MYSFRCWLSQWWTMPKGLQPYGRPFSGRRSSSYMHYKHSFPWYQLTSTHCCGYVNITFMCGRAGRPSFDDIGTVITMTRKDTVHLYENLLIGCETVESRTIKRWLMTAPGAPRTHWYQLHGVFSQPFYIMAGQEITGTLCMVTHNAQSYTMYLTMSAKMWGAKRGGIRLQENLMSYTATTILCMGPKFSSHNSKLKDRFDEGSVGWMECDEGLILLRSWKRWLAQEQWSLKLLHRCCDIGFHQLHQFCFKCSSLSYEKANTDYVSPISVGSILSNIPYE